MFSTVANILPNRQEAMRFRIEAYPGVDRAHCPGRREELWQPGLARLSDGNLISPGSLMSAVASSEPSETSPYCRQSQHQDPVEQWS